MLGDLWSPTIGGATISSAFSGIGSPEQATVSLQSYLRSAFGVVTRVEQFAAVEWNALSPQELCASSCKPAHMFCNMNEFINPRIRDSVLERSLAGRWAVDSLRRQLSKPSAVVTNAFCHICNCHCVYPRAQVHFAGAPCVDHSSQPGAKRRGLLGSSSLPLLVWCMMRVAVQESAIVHENLVARSIVRF